MGTAAGQACKEGPAIRAVVDTNVLISALLFRGAASALVPLWQTGRLRLIVSQEILAEYLRVLTYPKFKLDSFTVQALFEQHILPFCEVVEAHPGAPVCRDPDDDKFLWCAAAASADALISGDEDLLSLGPNCAGVTILGIRAALDRFV